MNHTPHRRPLATCLLAALGFLASTAAFAESVNITLPSTVAFNVTNVTLNTGGGTSAISYTSASLTLTHRLRIRIRADAAQFTPPAGASTIPAANVSWTTSGASGGTGYSGTLTAASFTRVFLSNPSPTTGSVNVTWTLSAPGASIRAGSHRLTAHWRVESVP
jgi:hypothetical protein